MPLYLAHGMENNKARVQAIQEGTEKISQTSLNEKEQQSFTIKSGEWHEQGFRNAMEDTSIIKVPFFENKPESGIFALFDGHDQYSTIHNRTANYAAAHLIEELKNITGDSEKTLKEGLRVINKNLIDTKEDGIIDNSGSTAIVALLDGNNLTVANLGDSRAILSRDGQAISLSEDHNLQNPAEKERVEQFTGKPQKTARLELHRSLDVSLTKALGDRAFIPLGLSDQAEIKSIQIQPDTDFLIIACDGIFEGGMDRQQAVNIAKASLEKHAGKENAEALAAQELVETAWTGYTQEAERQAALNIIMAKVNNVDPSDRHYIPRLFEHHRLQDEVEDEGFTEPQTYNISRDNLSAMIITFHIKKN